MFTFLKSLKDRARDFDWNGGFGILDILSDPTDVNSKSNDLLEAYGNITIESVRNLSSHTSTAKFAQPKTHTICTSAS